MFWTIKKRKIMGFAFLMGDDDLIAAGKPGLHVLKINTHTESVVAVGSWLMG